jgi:hypothetical protein
MIGRPVEGLALVDETITSMEANGALAYMPELLRVKAELLLALPNPALDNVGSCLAEALDWSRRQAALTWELRATIALAGLRVSQRCPGEARKLLQAVLKKFGKSQRTADLQAAERLLVSLR